MLSRSRMWVMGGLLLAVLLCFAAGFLAWARLKNMVACHDNQAPLSSFTANIEATQSQQLLEQFRKFADQNGFQFQVEYFTPDQGQFLIELTRMDTQVLARNPFAPGEFRIGFYNNDCAQPTSAADIRTLVSDLKSRIGRIPGAAFSEEK